MDFSLDLSRSSQIKDGSSSSSKANKLAASAAAAEDVNMSEDEQVDESFRTHILLVVNEY